VGSIAWSFLFWTLFTQSAADNESGAVKLYQQASSLIAAGESALAIPVLEQLFTEFPDSTLAPIAAARVAETHLSQNEPRQAVDLLVKWAPAVFTDPTATKLLRIDADFANRTLQVTKKSFALLPADDFVVLENALNAVSADSPVHCLLVSELAKRSAQKGELRKAIELLQLLGPKASAKELQLRSIDLPLALLNGEPTENDIAWIEDTLSKQHELGLSQRFSLQLAIAEAHRRSGRTQQSLKSLEQLSNSFEQTQATQATHAISTNSSNSISSAPSTPSPKQLQDWLATVQLRRSEIHLAQSDLAQARSLALSCIERFPNYSSLSQFRFVVAKCDIAQIDFEAARKQLAAVIESGTDSNAPRTAMSNPESIDQAWWMLGELDVMQRNYAVALTRYAMVLNAARGPRDSQPALDSKASRESPWKPRALLQSAKCHEMMGNPIEAYSAYQSIVTQYPRSDVANAARQRLKALELSKNNSANNQPPASPTNTIAR
jgi:TolA-binding protein